MTESDFQTACRIGDSSTIKRILSTNPDLLNSLDPDLGWPPLYRTVICCHIKASKTLLKSGANPNTKNKLGDSPLHQAVESNQISVVQLLLEHGADSNIRQNDGETPLHHACVKGLVGVAGLLIKFGGDPNLTEFVFGKTPLHIAVEGKNVKLIRVLVKGDAKCDLRDFSGRTALDICEEMRPYILDKDLDGSKKTQSFEVSELTGKIDSVVESENQNGATFHFSFGSDPNKNSMYKWLTSFKLEFLFGPLYCNGYDDLDFLLAQIRSNEALTPETLEEIGVRKIGHRLKLLALLDAEAFKDLRQSVSVKEGFLCMGKKVVCLENWLRKLGIGEIFVKFKENGIEDWETWVMIMESRFALTEDGLKALGIEKPAQRQKILTKIKEEIGNVRHHRALSMISIEKTESVTACEFCIIM